MTDGVLPDPFNIQRSWHTRMASVIRQFKTLTEEYVTDSPSGEWVEIVGLGKSCGDIRLTVVEAGGCGEFYSRGLDQLIPLPSSLE